MPEGLSSLAEEISRAFRKGRQPLDSHQAERFATYLELLELWNEKINLTAIRDRKLAIIRHFVEPAMAMPLLAGAGPVLLDAGSGPGVPGVPMKILDPQRTCLLVEANGKKATFLREVVEALGLDDIFVLEGRFEELVATGDLVGPVHVLTSRAWGSWGGLLGLGAGLMAPGGRAVIFVGEQTLRALRRYIGTTSEGGSMPPPDDEWAPAARAGWLIRRVLPLPHMEQAWVVGLEKPGKEKEGEE